jgi:hypothetical protein
MKNSDNTPINLNQLECSADPVWDSTLDCYKVNVRPKDNTTFYNTDTTSVEIRFNKQRTQLSTQYTNRLITGYYYRPTEGFDELALAWTLDQQNSKTLLTDNDQVAWTDRTTDRPKFTISGNETYTTRGSTAQTSSTQAPLEVTIDYIEKTALDGLITGINVSINQYLAFDYTPTNDDIRRAVNLGGNNGQALSNVQWDEITITINSGSKQATLTAVADSLQYKGSVALTYQLSA